MKLSFNKQNLCIFANISPDNIRYKDTLLRVKMDHKRFNVKWCIMRL